MRIANFAILFDDHLFADFGGTRTSPRRAYRSRSACQVVAPRGHAHHASRHPFVSRPTQLGDLLLDVGHHGLPCVQLVARASRSNASSNRSRGCTRNGAAHVIQHPRLRTDRRALPAVRRFPRSWARSPSRHPAPSLSRVLRWGLSGGRRHWTRPGGLRRRERARACLAYAPVARSRDRRLQAWRPSARCIRTVPSSLLASAVRRDTRTKLLSPAWEPMRIPAKDSINFEETVHRKARPGERRPKGWSAGSECVLWRNTRRCDHDPRLSQAAESPQAGRELPPMTSGCLARSPTGATRSA